MYETPLGHLRDQREQVLAMGLKEGDHIIDDVGHVSRVDAIRDDEHYFITDTSGYGREVVFEDDQVVELASLFDVVHAHAEEDFGEDVDNMDPKDWIEYASKLLQISSTHPMIIKHFGMKAASMQRSAQDPDFEEFEDEAPEGDGTSLDLDIEIPEDASEEYAAGFEDAVAEEPNEIEEYQDGYDDGLEFADEADVQDTDVEVTDEEEEDAGENPFESSLHFAVQEDQGFNVWMDSVNAAMTRLVGVGHEDIADQPWHDWYDAGYDPEDAADMALESEGWEASRQAAEEPEIRIDPVADRENLSQMIQARNEITSALSAPGLDEGQIHELSALRERVSESIDILQEKVEYATELALTEATAYSGGGDGLLTSDLDLVAGNLGRDDGSGLWAAASSVVAEAEAYDWEGFVTHGAVQWFEEQDPIMLTDASVTLSAARDFADRRASVLGDSDRKRAIIRAFVDRVQRRLNGDPVSHDKQAALVPEKPPTVTDEEVTNFLAALSSTGYDVDPDEAHDILVLNGGYRKAMERAGMTSDQANDARWGEDSDIVGSDFGLSALVETTDAGGFVNDLEFFSDMDPDRQQDAALAYSAVLRTPRWSEQLRNWGETGSLRAEAPQGGPSEQELLDQMHSEWWENQASKTAETIDYHNDSVDVTFNQEGPTTTLTVTQTDDLDALEDEWIEEPLVEDELLDPAIEMEIEDDLDAVEDEWMDSPLEEGGEVEFEQVEDVFMGSKTGATVFDADWTAKTRNCFKEGCENEVDHVVYPGQRFTCSEHLEECEQKADGSSSARHTFHIKSEDDILADGEDESDDPVWDAVEPFRTYDASEGVNAEMIFEWVDSPDGTMGSIVQMGIEDTPESRTAIKALADWITDAWFEGDMVLADVQFDGQSIMNDDLPAEDTGSEDVVESSNQRWALLLPDAEWSVVSHRYMTQQDAQQRVASGRFGPRAVAMPYDDARERSQLYSTIKDEPVQAPQAPKIQDVLAYKAGASA